MEQSKGGAPQKGQKHLDLGDVELSPHPCWVMSDHHVSITKSLIHAMGLDPEDASPMRRRMRCPIRARIGKVDVAVLICDPVYTSSTIGIPLVGTNEAILRKSRIALEEATGIQSGTSYIRAYEQTIQLVGKLSSHVAEFAYYMMDTTTPGTVTFVQMKSSRVSICLSNGSGSVEMYRLTPGAVSVLRDVAPTDYSFEMLPKTNSIAKLRYTKMVSGDTSPASLEIAFDGELSFSGSPVLLPVLFKGFCDMIRACIQSDKCLPFCYELERVA